MNIREKLFEQLVKIKDEINQHIPLASNRFEQFECAKADADFDEVVRQYKIFKKYCHTAILQYHIHEHLNEVTQQFLQNKGMASSCDLSLLQQQDLKAVIFRKIPELVAKMNYLKQHLKTGISVDIAMVQTYLLQHEEELIAKIYRGERLAIDDEDLVKRIELDKKLSSHRECVDKQFFLNNHLLLVVDEENKNKLLKAQHIWRGIYFDRIHSDIGYCDEHTSLALKKMYDQFLVTDTTIIEKVSIDYHNDDCTNQGPARDNDDCHNGGHVFLVINRDPDSRLNDISSWGKETILLDPWNKLVCFANDYASLPYHYFSYPDGGKWSSLKFDQYDYDLKRRLIDNDNYFLMTGNENREKRIPLLLEEYQLTSLDQPQFAATHSFLSALLKEVWPGAFDATIKLFITTDTSYSFVFTIDGLEEPAMAIRKDVLEQIGMQNGLTVEELKFGLAHALQCMKHYGVGNDDALTSDEHHYLDKLCLEQTKQGAAAINYLRQTMSAQPSNEEVYKMDLRSHLRLSFRSVLTSVGVFYGSRIKHLTILLAQDESLSREQKPTIDLPHFKHELAAVQSQHFFERELSQYATSCEKINYLCSQLPELQVELLPYELLDVPSRRLRDFCYSLSRISIDLNDQEQFLAAEKLINMAFYLKISGFDHIYRHLVGAPSVREDRNFKNKSLPLLGVFRDFQETIHAFVRADNYDVAMKLANEIQAYHPLLQNHFISFWVQELATVHFRQYQNKHQTVPKGQERFFGSTVGYYINWETFNPSHNKLPWKNHIAWALRDGTKSIAKTLMRLGVTRDRRLWQLFTPQEILLMLSADKIRNTEPQMITPLVKLTGNLSMFGDDQYLKNTTRGWLLHFSQSHVLQIDMFKQGVSFEEAYCLFYDANLPALIYPKEGLNDNNSTVHYLLQQFARVAVTGSDDEKQVIKSFYFGRKDGKDLKHLQSIAILDSILPYQSPYIQFLFEQHFKEYSFQLFTTDDYIKIINGAVSFFWDQIPPAQYIRIFSLPHAELNVPCLRELIPLMREHGMNHQIGGVILGYLHNQKCLPFSEETVMVLELMHKTIAHPAHSGDREKILTCFQWTPVSLHEMQTLKATDLITLYHVYDENLAFPSRHEQLHLGQLIFEKINQLDVDGKLLALSKLLFVRSDIKNNFLPVSDIHFNNQAIAMWVEAIVVKYGQDDGSVEYAAKLKKIVDEVYQGASYRDTIAILSHLANAIESQREISNHMGIKLEPDKYIFTTEKKNISHEALAVLAALADFLGKDKSDQIQFIRFLSSALTLGSVHDFADYLIQRGKAWEVMDIFGHQINSSAIQHNLVESVVQSIYYLFWDRRLEERAVIMNYLFIPPNKMITDAIAQKAYEESFDYVAKRLFPNFDESTSEDSLALAMLKAYLDTANEYARSYLLVAMLVAMNESLNSGHMPSVGKRFAMLCEHMGPAYVKLAQAVHSYPHTPQPIRDDLAHVKGRVSPPHRWQLWRLIDETLSIEDNKKIVRVNTLLGSASYNLALAVQLQDGQNVVLLLLREDAAKQAEEGFAHLKRAVRSCEHSQVNAHRDVCLSLLSEASELSTVEMSRDCGDRQYQIASQIYPLHSYQMGDYQINFIPAKNILSGHGYRFLERMHGVEFNDLPYETEEQKNIIHPVAKAVVQAELINMLSGRYFDCDRHGNQLRVLVDHHAIHLGLYDFGEMALVQPHDQELLQLKRVIEDFPQAVIIHQSLDIVLSHHIDQAMSKGQKPHYLLRIRKGLLALHDFQKHLSLADLVEILQNVAQAKQIHPLFKNALKTSTQKILWLVKVNSVTNDIQYAAQCVSQATAAFFKQASNQVKRLGEEFVSMNFQKKGKR